MKLMGLGWATAVLFLGCHAEVPQAKRGMVDLSRWSPADHEITLTGEWEFFWGRFLAPEDFRRNQPPEGGKFIRMPSFWGESGPGNQDQRQGYATYRLRAQLDQQPGSLALKIPKIFTSYSLYLNGVSYPGRGSPGIDKAGTVPQTYSNTVFFEHPGGELEILLHVANFHDLWGGPRYPLSLGAPEKVASGNLFSLVFVLLLSGALFMGATYHLGLFLGRTKEKATLYFGLLCLAIVLHTLLSGEVYLLHLFPDLPWEWENRLEYLALFLGELLFLLYFQSTFREETSRVALRWAIGLVLVLLVPVLVTDTEIYTQTLTIFEMLVVATTGYVIWVGWIALRNRKPAAMVSFVGMMVFFATVINELLSNNDFFNVPTPYLMSLGLFAFILSQSLVIATRFARATDRAEQLSLELTRYSNELEAKVVERTKQLESYLQQKTDFFVNLAHETRTPLTLILNHLDQYMKTHPATRDLSVIHENFLKLQRDMLSYLDVAKLSKGRFEYHHSQDVDVRAAVGSLLELFEATTRQRGIELIFEETEAGLVVRIDPAAFHQVLTNLLANALQVSPDHAKVWITVRVEDDLVVVRIRDQGPGVPPELAEAIFQPYYQHEARPDHHGVGMGLSIVQDILIACGGSVQVSNVPEGGAEFRLALLPGRSGAALTPIPETPQDAGVPARPVILLVEDNLDLRNLIVSQLPEFEVLATESGQQAIAMLGRGLVPQLVVSDLMMTPVDGLELFRSLRKQTRFQKIPFLLITAKSTIDRVQMLEDGMLDVLYKPFLVGELTAKIASIFRFLKDSRTQGLEEASRLIAGQLATWDGIAPSSGPTSEQRFREACERFQITDRQKEIIRGIAAGSENKEIADQLGISPHTVERHIQNLYEKTGAHNRVELLRMFQNIGI